MFSTIEITFGCEYFLVIANTTIPIKYSEDSKIQRFDQEDRVDKTIHCALIILILILSNITMAVVKVGGF